MTTYTPDNPELSGLLSGYTRIVVITGAGISAPSGIPTYRSAGSRWNDPDLEAKSHASRYGNHLPQLWEFWGHLRTLALAAQPNPAHTALTAAQSRAQAAGGWLKVATQNIDGLHGRAGTVEVAELHGSLARSRCIKRSCATVWDDATVPAAGMVPVCPTCGRPGRPDVVLFGEQLSSALLRGVKEHLRTAQLCVYVGTSGNVWPVNELVDLATRSGADAVLVNAEPWDEPNPAFTTTVLGDAAAILPRLLTPPR